MGLYDRDYYRSETAPSPWRATSEPVCRAIIVACIAVYVLQLVTSGSGVVTEALDLDPNMALFGFQWWRLVTFGFCHDPLSPLHIVFNMLLLWWFGSPLEQMYSSREFVRFYFVALFLSAAMYLALAFTLFEVRPAIGASGAIMAVVVLYAMHFPRHKIMVFFVFPIEIRWLVLAYVIWDIHPVLLALGGTRADGGVAHAAHLGGLAFGFAYKYWNLRLSGGRGSAFPRRERRSWNPFRRPNLRIYREEPPPSSSPLDDQVDAVLEKISRSGADSLTPRERQILIDASRRMRRDS